MELKKRVCQSCGKTLTAESSGAYTQDDLINALLDLDFRYPRGRNKSNCLACNAMDIHDRDNAKDNKKGR